MDYQQAQGQLAQVQQQSQAVMQKLQAVAQKLSAAAPDATTGREWAMDLREVALAIQSQTQTTTMLLTQMADYISRLENEMATHPTTKVRPTGWANQASGGGFLSSLTSGLGMGAGFAVADDVVNDLFNMF